MTAALDQLASAVTPDQPPTASHALRPITVRPALRREPPYDDELPGPHLRAVRSTDRPLPFEAPGRAIARPDEAAPAVRPIRGIGSRNELSDPETWARRLLVALLEARAGRRPLQQLATHLSTDVLSRVAADLRRNPPQGARAPLVRSVRASAPVPGVSEVSAVIELGPRCRAVAMRLEELGGRWRCVALQFG
jgi:hypothetical protein